MAGLGAKDILKNLTALEQLIEEINFQRAKEMRQCLMSDNSDAGFVMVHGTTYWTDLFVRHFLFQTDRSTDADDLLFFIRKKQMKGTKYIPKYHTEVEVYRKDSRKLPIGDPDIDWEETVYLNLIIHQFDYTLTLAICTRTSPKELQVLKRHSQKVYASPSRRRMDTKGEVEEITYPNVCFHIDNFDEVFADMLVRDGEMVCVELVASDHSGSRQAVIFLGSIRYDALKRVYDARASLSSKMAQRMMMGLFSGGSSQRIEFVRMKGPQGKGHAEMAVTKPKGSGVETPTSEPGISLLDLWDCDWEDGPEDMFMYRHQRRLSDPSANFNTFMNSGWVSRAEAKSKSENEGLDSFANGLYEIESGDVRDAGSSCRCCSMLACQLYEEEESGSRAHGACLKCGHFHGGQKGIDYYWKRQKTSSEHIGHAQSTAKADMLSNQPLEVRDVNVVPQGCDVVNDPEGIEVIEGAENIFYNEEPILQNVDYCAEWPVRPSSPEESKPFVSGPEIALMERGKEAVTYNPNSKKNHLKLYKMFSLKRKKKKIPGSAVRVISSKSEQDVDDIPLSSSKGDGFGRSIPLNSGMSLGKRCSPSPLYCKRFSLDLRDLEKKQLSQKCSVKLLRSASYNSLRLSPSKRNFKRQVEVPFRVTKDGTAVYFLCDLKLDDGAYNPLWTTKGFTQTFHFWKESRRAQSIPLNAHLTYVTLPWFTIVTDILDHRTGPILTF